MGFHTCGNSHTDREGLPTPRELCSFCAATAVSPDKRTNAMRMVIEGEQLQMEMLELLNAIPDLESIEAQHDNLLKVDQNANLDIGCS